eukprot:2844644-Pleurochrysis_carterae.AAC.1
MPIIVLHYAVNCMEIVHCLAVCRYGGSAADEKYRSQHVLSSQVAAELGAAPNATELSAMFSLLDSDVQGKVSFEAFRCMWLGEAEYRWV